MIFSGVLCRIVFMLGLTSVTSTRKSKRKSKRKWGEQEVGGESPTISTRENSKRKSDKIIRDSRCSRSCQLLAWIRAALASCLPTTKRVFLVNNLFQAGFEPISGSLAIFHIMLLYKNAIKVDNSTGIEWSKCGPCCCARPQSRISWPFSTRFQLETSIYPNNIWVSYSFALHFILKYMYIYILFLLTKIGSNQRVFFFW